MKKSWKIGTLTMTAMFVLAGCGGSSSSTSSNASAPSPAPAPAAKSGKTAVAYSVPGLQFPFFLYQMHFVEKAATKYNDVSVETLDARNDPAKQTADVEAAINKKVSGILISPLTDALAPAIKKAQQAGIPVVTIDRQINGADYLAHVGADNVQVGKTEAQFIVDKLGDKGNIVILDGTPGASAAEDRKKGFHEILDQHKNIKVVAEQAADFDRAKGLSVLESIMQAHPDVSAVIAANDDMALGAVQALKSKQLLAKVVVIGCDATPDALKAVKDGELTATVEQYGDKQAEAALQILIDYIQNNKKPDQKVNYITPKAISKDNLNEAVVKQ